MPRERTLSAYANDHYLALVNRVIETQADVLVEMTQAQAASLRGEIYAWRRAAEKTPQAAEARGINLDRIRKVAFRIGPEGLTALLQSKLPGPSAIEAALGKIDKALSPAQVAYEELQKLMKEGGKEGPTLPYDLKDDK